MFAWLWFAGVRKKVSFLVIVKKLQHQPWNLLHVLGQYSFVKLSIQSVSCLINLHKGISGARLPSKIKWRYIKYILSFESYIKLLVGNIDTDLIFTVVISNRILVWTNSFVVSNKIGFLINHRSAVSDFRCQITLKRLQLMNAVSNASTATCHQHYDKAIYVHNERTDPCSSNQKKTNQYRQSYSFVYNLFVITE